MESKLEKLSLDGQKSNTPGKTKSLKGKGVVVDSWEQDSASGSDAEVGDEEEDQEPNTSIPNAPPPTPIASSKLPTWESHQDRNIFNSQFLSSTHHDRDSERRRPEKSTAVAGRMIAGALGVRPAKKTEEQTAYECSVKEQEIKRKTREKAGQAREREEAERAKKEIWDG